MAPKASMYVTVWEIYLHEWLNFMVALYKYTYMDPMGGESGICVKKHQEKAENTPTWSDYTWRIGKPQRIWGYRGIIHKSYHTDNLVLSGD